MRMKLPCLTELKAISEWQQRLGIVCVCTLDRVDPSRRAKVVIWKKLVPTRRVTLPLTKGDLARWVTPLAELTLCFSCKRLVAFCKEM